MNYTSESIKTMLPLHHIRAFVGRYLGEHNTPKGHTHLIKELVDNSVDEAIIDGTHQHHVHITVLQGKDHIQVIVEDQGRGIPLASLTAAFSEPRTSGKWSTAYVGTAGVHGEGAKAVAAISKRFVGLSRRAGEGHGLVEIADGSVRISKTSGKDKKNIPQSGTLVFFESDPKFLTMDPIYCSNEGGYPLLLELLEFLGIFVHNITFHVYQRNELMKFNVDDTTELSELWTLLSTYARTSEVFTSKSVDRRTYVKQRFNIKSDVVWDLTLTRKLNPHDHTDSIGVDLDLFATNDLNNGIVSSVNLIPITDMGSFHITVIIQLIKERLAGMVANKEVRSFFVTNYRFPLCGFITVRVREPKFVGQTKDQYRDKEFIDPYRRLLKPLIDHTSTEHWEKLYALIEEHLNNEYSSFINKGLISAQGLKNIGLRLNKPSRYSDCDTKNPDLTELFITEGTSAGGIVAQVRDPAYQAVFCMTGKSLNAIRCDLADLSANAVLQDLIMVLGIKPGAKDLTGLNFGKVIILTDADSDGHHIAALLIGFMFRLCPMLFESRKVYISNPPLYSLSIGRIKGYLKDNNALMDSRIQSVYTRTLGITLRNSTTNAFVRLEDENYRSYIYQVKHVGSIMENVAHIVTVEPVYLEALASVVDYLTPLTMNEEEIRKQLNLDKVTYVRESNTLILTVSQLDVIVPLANLANVLRAELMPELQRMAWDQVSPSVKFLRDPSQPASVMTVFQLYHCLKELDALLPVSRYKGLGEMPPPELAKACVDPATRSYFMITETGDVEKLYAALGTDPKQRKLLLQG